MIRPAKPSDADSVVPLIIQAMGELAGKFVNSKSPEVISKFFLHFFQLKNNQYSFENTLVYSENEEIIGSLNAYDGASLIKLRDNFLADPMSSNETFNSHPEPETQEGEFYFDTISVKPSAQGKGIGKALIHAGIAWAKKLGHKQVGLLVEKENTRAKELYEKLEFKTQNTKIFFGGTYLHLIFNVEVN
ncbi:MULTISPECIES: GNAT family N-acetyltransferase [Pedobacter]|uniref:GNAT family N-acetyltransferase n=1 Tax=Pedobacter TaxID=84567 RepID=UPI001E60C26E|nr:MULTISPECIES: GNAT family N-acetyltransferase [Pedobacter]